MKKDLAPAIEHLSKSVQIYPSFVSAHNALGTAYLNESQNELARGEFAKAVALDSHLPNSYLNLACAQLALQQYPDAEKSLQSAAAIAPLDPQLIQARSYAEFMNHDYAAVIADAHSVHSRKHDGSAIVHYFAAGALEAQNRLPEAQQEMETFLAEDPKAAAIPEYRRLLDQIKADQAAQAKAARRLGPAVMISPAGPTAEQASARAQELFQIKKEQLQIAEAESSPDPGCAACGPGAGPAPLASVRIPATASRPSARSGDAPALRIAVDEVQMLFAVSDHGKSVTGLTAAEIAVLDNGKPPQAVLDFRNESALPLRLGLIIDTSSSITGRFAFEQAAAAKFLKAVLTGKDDLAFVVGVNNSVLVVQDFTADQAAASHAISQLAPGGGTCLWDAVGFAAEKLARRQESQPVARMLVIISDGKDNSSKSTLKQAIARAQQGEVAVYTVSTGEGALESAGDLVGDRALKTLSDFTGASAFQPGSLHGLTAGLADLQQLIRGRYLISYKPAAFTLDGQYRSVTVQAEREGRKLTVLARKGYYASSDAASPSDPQ